ncbi:unnamed protein product [Litomosoides sigmodontis]|uniref:Uncharacterized protein n=1 Tax=Litomosoides sigmodontis TaxID=42156 RepID=A0A3P6TR25_LITSI|nr:unnamed protein product [Litomosoides sigmodontis]
MHKIDSAPLHSKKGKKTLRSSRCRYLFGLFNEALQMKRLAGRDEEEGTMNYNPLLQLSSYTKRIGNKFRKEETNREVCTVLQN